MAGEKFYPSITSLIKVDDLPEQLGFLKTAISTTLGKLFYKKLQVSKSTRGDSAFYSLSIVSLQKIDIEIPGTGFYIILNPGIQTTSEFPVTLSYQWPILSYVRGLNLSNFSFNAADFYDLALKILGISETELVNRVLDVFITTPTPINQFVDDMNEYIQGIIGTNPNPPYTLIPYPLSGNPVQEVITEIHNRLQTYNINQNVSLIIFTFYFTINRQKYKFLK